MGARWIGSDAPDPMQVIADHHLVDGEHTLRAPALIASAKAAPPSPSSSGYTQ
jgi:hypothetical protein